MRGDQLSAILFSLTTATVITPITFKYHYDCAFQCKIIFFHLPVYQHNTP